MKKQCRATETIRPAIETGVEVPDIGPICHMTAKARPPTVAELRQCQDLHYLARHFQTIFFALDGGKYTRFIEERDGESESTWADRFHRAIFRVFLAGAVLYKAHNHPIWLRICQENVRFRWAVPQTREFVRQALHDFPAYRNDDEAKSEIFGPLLDWLAEDSRARAKRLNFVSWYATSNYQEYCTDILGMGTPPAIDGYDSAGDFVRWELMTMLLAAEILSGRFPYMDSLPTSDYYEPRAISGRASINIRLISLSNLRLEQVSIPFPRRGSNLLSLSTFTPVKDWTCYLFNDLPDTVAPYSWSGNWFVASMDDELNAASELPSSFRFWTFALKKLYRLEFKAEAFARGSEGSFSHWKLQSEVLGKDGYLESTGDFVGPIQNEH